MRRILFILCLIILTVASAFAQRKPKDFPEKNNPGDLDAIYTQEDGADKKVLFHVARNYFVPQVNLVPINYVPDSTGNANNRGQFVRDSLNRLYYIDGAGRATQFGQTVNVYEKSAIADTTEITVPVEGDIVFVDSTLMAFRGASSWLVFKGGTEITTDNTLTGNGTTASPLAVNRDTFPDRSDVTQEIADTATVLRDSLTDLRSALDAVAADLAAQQDSMSNKVIASLTNNRVPVATGARTLGNSYLLQGPNGVTLDAQKFFRQTGGTTLQRPAGSAGMEWYNTDTNTKQVHNGNTWYNVVIATIPANQIVYGSASEGLTSSSVFTMSGSNPTSTGYFRSNRGVSAGIRVNDNSLTHFFELRAGDDVFGNAPFTSKDLYINMRGNEFNQVVSLAFSHANASNTSLNSPHFVFTSHRWNGLTNINEGVTMRVVRNSSTLNDYYFSLAPFDSTGFLNPIMRILPSGSFAIGNITPTQKLHVSGGNIRNEGAYYDSNNEPGSAGQRLQSTATGTDWTSEHLGFNRYTTDPDTLSPAQGTVYELDSEAGASGWTQQIKATNLPTGGSFSVLINTTTGRDITFDSVSGDFYYNTFEGSASGTLVFSGISVKYLEFIWTGTAWLVIDLK